MRIAALAFGVLAGLIASLILALGGLDVSTAGAVSGDRQVQAIRFGLFIIGNLGFFGAALALAAPLAGGVLLVVAALAWAAAALLLHHTNELVLVTPPVLLLLAAIPAFIAHFRPSRSPAPEPEIIAPLRRSRPVEEPYDDEPDIGMANFAEPPPRASAFSMPDDERRRTDDWNPRRRRPVPPRARPAFRPTDDEDEQSGFSRFALSASTILSFGLYAALAGAALLVFWTLGDNSAGTAPTVATAEVSSAPPSAEPAPSSEPTLAPVLPAAAVTTPATPTPPANNRLPAIGGSVAQPVRVVGEEPQPAGGDNFGEVVMSDDPLSPPRLVEAPGLPFDETTASVGEASAPEPVDLEPEPEIAPLAPGETTFAGTPTVGPMMPFTMTPQMAALRTARGTGPSQAAPAPSSSGDAGL